MGDINEVERLERVSEVAKRLGVSQPFVYRLMDRGELPYVQLGRARRISPAAVEAFIRGHAGKART
jgi:excisionase family DNA binding protein